MHWWNRELSRQLLALPLALAGLLAPGEPIVRILACWDLYAIGYLLLTWTAFRRRDPAGLRAVALASRRPRLADRLLASSPEQVSQSAAVVALVATVIAMPQARSLGASSELVLGICIVAVVTAWLTLHTGFAIVYARLYAEGGGLEFPGDDEPGLVDFVYFAAAIGTTSGTTDVLSGRLNAPVSRPRCRARRRRGRR